MGNNAPPYGEIYHELLPPASGNPLIYLLFCPDPRGTGIALYGNVKEILLCTNNPILTKSLYGILRDEGCNVEIADHPSDAVQMVLRREYGVMIIDSEPFGLSVDDAIKIIKRLLPDIIVIFVGDDAHVTDALSIDAPIDLAEFKRAIRNVGVFGRVSQSL
jgi:CheY-like chemotaxis protein